ncbi:hypothetical protein EV663_102193 [Rhodovulum bhavnagarense]|uniref:Uncharacterized protein n=1 Tax=Rhodovulum bhavnagarense TaxID=992286 RepID=A0A4R2RIP0_9RHOB|nr:hypothetical protein EV663_102193 [Rhodovulum bhavnagarense]
MPKGLIAACMTETVLMAFRCDARSHVPDPDGRDAGITLKGRKTGTR